MFLFSSLKKCCLYYIVTYIVLKLFLLLCVQESEADIEDFLLKSLEVEEGVSTLLHLIKRERC